jgi:hypothetical protein
MNRLPCLAQRQQQPHKAGIPFPHHVSRRHSRRGIILIGAYLLLSILVVYSSSMTIRTTSQRLVTERLSDGLAATDLAQGAAEQLREDFYQCLSTTVASAYQSQVGPMLSWVDAVGQVAAEQPRTSPLPSRCRSCRTRV